MLFVYHRPGFDGRSSMRLYFDALERTGEMLSGVRQPTYVGLEADDLVRPFEAPVEKISAETGRKASRAVRKKTSRKPK